MSKKALGMIFSIVFAIMIIMVVALVYQANENKKIKNEDYNKSNINSKDYTNYNLLV